MSLLQAGWGGHTVEGGGYDGCDQHTPTALKKKEKKNPLTANHISQNQPRNLNEKTDHNQRIFVSLSLSLLIEVAGGLEHERERGKK